MRSEEFSDFPPYYLIYVHLFPYFNCCFLSQNCKSCFISCVVANAVKRTKWSALKISQNLSLVSEVWVLIYLFFNMGDNVKCLRKANDNLKRQMQDLATDFQTFKNKMAEKNDAAIASLSTENDVQYLSDGYDALVQYKTNMVEDLQNLSWRMYVFCINRSPIQSSS